MQMLIETFDIAIGIQAMPGELQKKPARLAQSALAGRLYFWFSI
jgi:hypothetical protein